MGIVFITHFLDQVHCGCDRVTVSRNGRLVGTRPAAELPQVELVSMMLGRALIIQAMNTGILISGFPPEYNLIVKAAVMIVILLALSGFFAGLAGVVFALYTSTGYPLSAVGVELDTIAAVVIGGTSLLGGTGLVAGTLVGVAIQGVIQTYIVFDGTLSSRWTKIVIGLLLLLFIALQRALVALSARGTGTPAPATCS